MASERQYLQACERAAAVLQALATMALTPTPENYRIWYVHLAGEDPALSQALAALLASGGRITEAQCGEHRQVDAGEDRKTPLLIGGVSLCGKLGAGDLGPDGEGLRTCGSVLDGSDVIAGEMEEVVDLVMNREEPLHLPGRFEPY